MKELSIEEKSQRYDEAIERAKSIDVHEYGDIIEAIFPELKESEDERISGNIIATIHLYYGEPLDDEAKEMIAWLEKQAEHANFINKIQVGDKVTRNEDGVLVNLSQLNRVAKKQTEQKLYVNDNAKEMFIKALECVEEQNNKGYKLTDCDKNSWWEDFKAYTSCTIEQKPAAWSEEDSPYYDDICEMLINLLHSETADVNKGAVQKDLDWLMSLKPQSTWKPSEEQIASITCAVRKMKESACYDSELVSLFNDLKKLKG